ncbi:hypothetical protein [Pacificoceanicola onchidii]|uniref:hypothetical protein n=1 Tax=Pacificoceanicola onchidii TaxID=2562685 RepID=UPI0014562115|nr:hypothetical protein [Pacificoceanicola onchidii]
MFTFVFRNSGLRLMHSPDLDDMRRAMEDDDQAGPDGGTPHVRRQPPSHPVLAP